MRYLSLFLPQTFVFWNDERVFFLFSLLGIVVVAEKKHGKLLIVGILFVARSSEIRFTTHKRANLASRQIKLGIGRVFP